MGIRIGNVFYGTEGYLELQAWEKSNGEWKAFRKREKEPFAGSKDEDANQMDSTLLGPDSLEHFSNFVAAIRSGSDKGLNCNVTEGFHSSALPHLANISYQVGRELKFQNEQEKFDKDPEADSLLTRIYRKPYEVNLAV